MFKKMIKKRLGRQEASPTLGSVREPVDNHEKHLNFAGEADNQAREGDAHLSLGIAYDSHSNFPKAIKGYEKSLNIARAAGDRAREGDAYLNLLIAYKSIGDFPKAIECFEKSLDIAREAGDWTGISLANRYRGHTGEAGEGRTYNINGNFYRTSFCEFRKQLHHILVLPRIQDFAFIMRKCTL